MTKAAQQVLEDALLLSTPDRATVVDGLLESIDPPSSEDGLSHEKWLSEVERRARAAHAGKPGIEWEAAKAGILKRLDLE